MDRALLDISEQFRTKLNENYPLGLIPRKKIGEATGGILHPRTMANEDSLCKGISNPIMVKGNVCYRIEQILEYLFDKTSDTLKTEKK